MSTRQKLIQAMVLISIFLAGCSDFEDPTRKISLETIVGGGPLLSKGMTQDEVHGSWGPPDKKKIVGETRWGAPIQQWTYYGRFPEIPVDYKYVSKGRNLFFEGDALVRWELIVEKGETEEDPQKNQSSKSSRIGALAKTNFSKMDC